MRSHMWQPWDTTSVNIATGEDNVSKLNAGTKASIKLWPNEARIQFRLKKQGMGLVHLLALHEAQAEKFIEFVTNLNLGSLPTSELHYVEMSEEEREEKLRGRRLDSDPPGYYGTSSSIFTPQASPPSLFGSALGASALPLAPATTTTTTTAASSTASASTQSSSLFGSHLSPSTSSFGIGGTAWNSPQYTPSSLSSALSSSSLFGTGSSLTSSPSFPSISATSLLSHVAQPSSFANPPHMPQSPMKGLADDPLGEAGGSTDPSLAEGEKAIEAVIQSEKESLATIKRQPDTLTALCEKLVKQGVTKENVFKMIEAIGDHSLDVYNYCLHFIVLHHGVLRESKDFKSLREDLRLGVENHLKITPRVKRHGVVISSRLPDNGPFGTRYNANDNVPMIAVYEDVHAVIPLPDPANAAEDEIAVMRAVMQRVAGVMDALHEQHYYPAGASNSYSGFGSTGTGLVQFVCKINQQSLNQKLVNSELRQKVKEMADKHAAEEGMEVKRLLSTNCTGSQKNQSGSPFYSGSNSRNKLTSASYNPIPYQVTFSASYEVVPLKPS